MELAVLESVVEDVQARAGDFAFGEKACFVAFGTDVYGYAGLLRDEERLVTVAGGGALGRDALGLPRAALVAAGEDVRGDVLPASEFDEAEDDGGFAAASDGEVADAEDRVVEAPGG